MKPPRFMLCYYWQSSQLPQYFQLLNGTVKMQFFMRQICNIMHTVHSPSGFAYLLYNIHRMVKTYYLLIRWLYLKSWLVCNILLLHRAAYNYMSYSLAPLKSNKKKMLSQQLFYYTLSKMFRQKTVDVS